MDRPPDGYVNSVIGERCDFKVMEGSQNDATRRDAIQGHLRCHSVPSSAMQCHLQGHL